MMDAFQVYKLYQAVRLHFTNEKYDIIVHRGKMKHCSESAFYEKPGSRKFHFLSKQLADPQQAVQFFISCFAYDADVFDSTSADAAFFLWKKNKEMLTQLILDDIEQIGDITSALSGDPCKLQQLVAGGHVNIETAVALNKFLNYSSSWKNNFAYKGLAGKIEKLNAFVKFNESKVNEVLQHEQQFA
jgi:hypothetical protein